MNLFIDEAGSFVSSGHPTSWSVVGCFCASDDDFNRAYAALRTLKKENGFSKADEVKLSDLEEDSYFVFLDQLRNLGATYYAIATNSNLNTLGRIKAHQDRQAFNITEFVENIKHDSAKKGVWELRKKVEGLSPQLYVQLSVQIGLMFKTLHSIVSYYIQRDPLSLSRFKWRIDPKNVSRTAYEDAFEILASPLIQTRSITDPMKLIEGADYSVLQRYEFENGPPKYLKESYGIEVRNAMNLGKIIREDIDFPDSKTNVGLQMADLITSGVRRNLWRGFSQNELAAGLLGSLMVQAPQNAPPMDLLTFGDPIVLDEETAELIRIMISTCKPYLTPETRSRD